MQARGSSRRAASFGQRDGTVQIERLTKKFGSTEVLRGVDLVIPSGSIVCVMGRSGGGKSTLLRCINLLEVPTSGRIAIGGKELYLDKLLLSRRGLVVLRRQVGMIYQSFQLFPHLTAIENIMLPQMVGMGVRRQEAASKSMELLRAVGLDHRAVAYPREMSGGEQQRAAIARTLSADPLVLLCDEPTSALDPESTGEVLEVLKRLSHHGMTMLVATHEQSFAAEVADSIIFMDQGRILESGPPRELMASARQQRTREFFNIGGTRKGQLTRD